MALSFKNVVLITLVTSFLASCAQQRAPMGGPKDEDAPRIVASAPLNGSVNYNESSISFEFDEFVRVSAATKELLVTPPFESPVQFKMRGKKVMVEWTDTLIPNTTYLFQFGKGIVDVNEGNPLDSNLFVFSTGDFIDSFEMKGRVIDAFTLKPVKDVWVMLYADNIDSMPYLNLPRYFAKTDEKGNYFLKYLSNGSYKVFALQAINNGYLFDQPDEAIGFLDKMKQASNPKDTAKLNLEDILLFKEADTLQFLKEFKQIQNKGITFLFNQPVDSLSLDELSGKDISSWTPQWNQYLDSVAFWFNTPDDYDSLRLHVWVEGFEDTVFFRKPAQRGFTKGKKDASVELALKPEHPSKVNHFSPYILKSETPLGYSDFGNSLLISNGDTLPLADYLRIGFSQIDIEFKWKEGTKYNVFIPDSSICDRFGLCNDTLSFTFVSSKKEDFGELTIKHKLPEKYESYVWQLLKSDGKVALQEIVKPIGSVNYRLLPAGKYQVRIIGDANLNGKWDSGLYLKNRQPEEVFFYDQEIEVRGNWQSEIEWTLDQKMDF